MENKNCEQYVVGRVEYLENRNRELREENHRLKVQLQERNDRVATLLGRIERVKSIFNRIMDYSGKSIRIGYLYAWGDETDGYSSDDFKFIVKFLGLKVKPEETEDKTDNATETEVENATENTSETGPESW